VVTHHLPHPGSVAKQHFGSALNPAFVSNLEWLISKHSPALWVHGHTHTGCDYRVGETRIVCNPLGSPGEDFVTFDPAWVVEV
jgi:Icc-related predicted phosphoesterase